MTRYDGRRSGTLTHKYVRPIVAPERKRNNSRPHKSLVFISAVGITRHHHISNNDHRWCLPRGGSLRVLCITTTYFSTRLFRDSLSSNISPNKTTLGERKALVASGRCKFPSHENQVLQHTHSLHLNQQTTTVELNTTQSLASEGLSSA